MNTDDTPTGRTTTATPGTEHHATLSLLPDLPPAGHAAIRGGIFGNYVDQINIFLPVTALAPAVATVAGPHAAVATGAIVVMATLIGRPLGAMLFGSIADAIGRTRSTKIAIAGTAACSYAIAAVPNHQAIGAWSIGIVIAARFIGGIFLAGEYTSAIPLAMEWSRPRRRGLISGLIMSMAPWAQATIALITTLLLTLLGTTDYAAWGWRISFAAGGTASLVMLWFYTKHVADAPIFTKQPRPHRALHVGLRDVVVGAYARSFWQMFGLMTGLWLMTNMVVIYATSRLRTDIGLNPRDVSIAMAIASIAQAIVMAMTGHLSSLTGRRRFFILWGAVATVSGPTLWWLLLHQKSLPAIALFAAALQVLTVCAYGPIGAYLSERFPTHVRATGYGTAYSLSIVIPALYPYYLPVLQNWWGHDGAVMVVLALGGVLVAGCGALGPALRPTDLDADVEVVANRHGKPVEPQEKIA